MSDHIRLTANQMEMTETFETCYDAHEKLGKIECCPDDLSSNCPKGVKVVFQSPVSSIHHGPHSSTWWMARKSRPGRKKRAARAVRAAGSEGGARCPLFMHANYPRSIHTYAQIPSRISVWNLHARTSDSLLLLSLLQQCWLTSRWSHFCGEYAWLEPWCQNIDGRRRMCALIYIASCRCD